jgi:hypothetical protein
MKTLARIATIAAMTLFQQPVDAGLIEGGSGWRFRFDHGYYPDRGIPFLYCAAPDDTGWVPGFVLLTETEVDPYLEVERPVAKTSSDHGRDRWNTPDSLAPKGWGSDLTIVRAFERREFSLQNPRLWEDPPRFDAEKSARGLRESARQDAAGAVIQKENALWDQVHKRVERALQTSHADKAVRKKTLLMLAKVRKRLAKERQALLAEIERLEMVLDESSLADD